MPATMIDVGITLPKDIIGRILSSAPTIPNPVDPVTNTELIAKAREQISKGNGIAGISEEKNPDAEYQGGSEVLYSLILDPWISEGLGLGNAGLNIPEALYRQIYDLIQQNRG